MAAINRISMVLCWCYPQHCSWDQQGCQRKLHTSAGQTVVVGAGVDLAGAGGGFSLAHPVARADPTGAGTDSSLAGPRQEPQKPGLSHTYSDTTTKPRGAISPGLVGNGVVIAGLLYLCPLEWAGSDGQRQ